MTKRAKVHLVMAEYSYEGSCVVRAYVDEAAAGAFAQRCREHAAKQPKGPTVIEDTPENDAEHAAWWAKHDRWERSHPAKYHTGADSYSVHSIRLFPSNK